MSNNNKKNSGKNSPVVRNKRATFDYEVLDTYTAGLVLAGTEVKSLREGKAGLTDTYCLFDKGELWVKNAYIAEYFYGTYNNHNSHRDRKLLLSRRELRNLENDSKETGLTIVPLKIFFNEKGIAKMEIALCRGKKQYDKRESIKEKDSKRELDRARRDFGKY
ncbi:MAG: SsrA-binding protein SmpB [Bacteroidales bacterium]|nr:SsrA-binding protein SmpB [Bacteroidales bacterium]MBO7378438.1 SsrA-binding protein SmpB [Bacteroidales bacterium]MBP5214681.1 SsrA-binding protein SmpB [Bacteroidales bacterium]MBP5764872.1 SsrA-binding protein SmpB [Bacteroidales bacterium]